jgi:ATP-dependent Lhr-like helicase
MNDNPFHRLAPFIQEFIYRKQWKVLRESQVEACRVVLDTSKHMLIASGTASGKTEAAFFPVLTLLESNPSSSVGILYISPLKALINDQFQRLNELLREARIPVWSWHGDVAQSAKQRLLKNPSGILQITPESLEGLLMNRPAAIPSLFGDLRFVIIDEVHSFMGTDRGIQLQCQLTRLTRMAGSVPRRIGLSATLNDYTFAADWLASGTANEVEVVAPQGGRRLRLAVEHFAFPQAENAQHAALAEAQATYYQTLYDITCRQKAIIFTNSRTDAEITTMELRHIAQQRHEPDVFYVHHGNISTMLREEAEAALRDGPGPAVAAATLTLELGIDLGKLDRVVQLGAPYSCASFVQRLGRSGRREDAASEMIFLCPEEEHESVHLPARLPWTLLRAIAVIELYIREKWVESFTARKMPVGLLYHQTMSILKSLGEATPAELAKAVLTLPPFKEIHPDDYRVFLRHLLQIDHLERTETGTLIIGLAGERVVNNFRFYAVFRNDEEFTVYHASEEIGSISEIPPVGSCFSLAGKLWKVAEVDRERKSVFVTKAKGKAETLWSGTGGDVDTRVMKKIRKILQDRTIYSYLKPNAVIRLEQARRFAQESGLLKQSIIAAGGDSFYILPWLGSKAFRTLERLLKYEWFYDLNLRSIMASEPYYLTVSGRTDQTKLKDKILQLGKKKDLTLLAEDETPILGKYDEFVAPQLLRKAFEMDGVDLAGVVQHFNFR